MMFRLVSSVIGVASILTSDKKKGDMNRSWHKKMPKDWSSVFELAQIWETSEFKALQALLKMKKKGLVSENGSLWRPR